MARKHWVDNEAEHAGSEASSEQQKEVIERQRDFQASHREDFQTSNREELIQCIKRGENPIWIPSPALEALAAQHNAEQADYEIFRPQAAGQPISTQLSFEASAKTESSQPALLLGHGMAEPIERPRSALHAGDFRENRTPATPQRRVPIPTSHQDSPPLSFYGSSPPAWHPAAPIPSLNRLNTDPSNLSSSLAEANRRARAPSLGSSLSSSFVMRVPTSPLVHATSNASLDFPYQDQPPGLSTSPDKSNRRRTLPPESFRSLQENRAPNFSRPLPQPQMRREVSLPNQGHQPRRSLTSFTYQPTTSNTTPPFLRSRRPSYASDASPRAAMVGSFEESILRGRMSTPPSKPLDFMAQIGVLGKGNCKPSLRCPAHVTVPFRAVFYSYSSTQNGRSTSDEHPSPYVGNIDLEGNLKSIETAEERKQRRLDAQDPEDLMADITAPENTAIGRALARDAKAKKQNLSSPKAPLGGCYRVPQQGQLQIIIKNPNKTAVKLYLVPYDLQDMKPGTKTFVRQRSYSAGPILEKALTDKANSQQILDPLKDKHVLRYLIHLKFCCTSKDRFYLYDNIRVVFANRVPDGKENLRNEVQLPQPKYSAYKPGKERTSSMTGNKPFVEMTNKRQSSGIGDDHVYDVQPTPSYLASEGVPPLPTSAIPFHVAPRSKAPLAKSEPSQSRSGFNQSPIPDLPFRFPDAAAAAAKAPDAEAGRTMSPTPGFHASTSTRGSPVPWAAFSNTSSPRSFSPAPPEAGNGLLSRKLRELNGHPSSTGTNSVSGPQD